jgi:hypothetical protein
MVPKDKAKELMFLFSNKIQKYDTILYQKKLSKKCALIAVDEILDLNLGLSNCDEGNWAIDKFYLEVKQEIEKL